MQEISSIGTWQVRHLVGMETTGGPGNPSSSAVQLAFLPTPVDPVSGDWKSGTWEQTPTGGWVAQCLVGPSGVVTLGKGTYYVWIKIADPTETPETCVGMLEVT